MTVPLLKSSKSLVRAIHSATYRTVKPETLASGNFDELESNRQTLTFQSKATKQNKRLPTYKSAKQNKRLCQHFAKVPFTKIP